MTMQYNIYEAKTKLSELVEKAANGEEIVICKAGKPLARLMPLAKQSRDERKGGFLKGKIWVADDFDAPLPGDMLGLFEGERDPLLDEGKD